MKRIKILDCTLRDGGYALEHKANKNLPVKTFTRQERIDFIKRIAASNIDIIELGTVQKTQEDKRDLAIYSSIEDLSNELKGDGIRQKCAVFFRGPDIQMSEIPEWREGLCEVIRLCLRHSELKKSLDYCYKLIEKGYKVSVQPSVTMRYTEQELHEVIEAANDMNAYAVYFVDSYGYMTPADVKRFVSMFDTGLNDNIQIGFHAHNNLNFAMANVIELLKNVGERKIIIDSCCLGMGQGAGNLQTEVIAGYLNEKEDNRYNYIALLEACEIIGNYWNDNLWGYSVPNAISATYKAAYGYALELVEEYKACFSDIAKILQYTPDESRYRFTKKDLELIINIAKENGEILKI